MKKVVILLLVLVLAFSINLDAYAAGEEDVWWGECVRLTGIEPEPGEVM